MLLIYKVLIVQKLISVQSMLPDVNNVLFYTFLLLYWTIVLLCAPCCGDHINF